MTFGTGIINKSKYFLFVLIIILLFWTSTTNLKAYVMPAEQLLDFMGGNFSRFRTLFVTQSIQRVTSEDQQEKVMFLKKTWLKAPNLFYSEITVDPNFLNHMSELHLTNQYHKDLTFWPILLGNGTSELMSQLKLMGIDLKLVSFTRFEGIIAYCLGKKDNNSPMLLIDKNRFLPLMLNYWYRLGTKTNLISIKFGDYRKQKMGWFPYKITYYVDYEPKELYQITNFSINTPITYPLAIIPMKNSKAPSSLPISSQQLKKNTFREESKEFQKRYPEPEIRVE